MNSSVKGDIYCVERQSIGVNFIRSNQISLAIFKSGTRTYLAGKNERTPILSMHGYLLNFGAKFDGKDAEIRSDVIDAFT